MRTLVTAKPLCQDCFLISLLVDFLVRFSYVLFGELFGDGVSVFIIALNLTVSDLKIQKSRNRSGKGRLWVKALGELSLMKGWPNIGGDQVSWLFH